MTLESPRRNTTMASLATLSEGIALTQALKSAP